jgi:hypothetical protein
MALKQFDLPALNVNETNSLSDVFNDDVDTTGTRIDGALSLQAGRDTAIWKYKYKKGGPAYDVVSEDPIIDSLILYGDITKPMKVTVTLNMYECDLKKPVFSKEWENLTWHKGVDSELEVASGGSLKGVELNCINRFEIRVRVLSSSSFTALQLSRIVFNWEASDIEPCEC